jgi:hypothetical protein
MLKHHMTFIMVITQFHLDIHNGYHTISPKLLSTIMSTLKIPSSPAFMKTRPTSPTNALFVWLISYQPAVLFSQNKPATNNQPAVLFAQNKPAPAISHQPNEQAESRSKRAGWSTGHSYHIFRDQ